MNKILILLLLNLSFSIACHVSCNSCNRNICSLCSDPNSQMDRFSRSCSCKEGYYTDTLNPFKCTKSLSGNGVDDCQVEVTNYVGNFKIVADCYYQTIKDNNGDNNYVISEIGIDTSPTNFPGDRCRNELKTEIQYQPYGYNNPKEDDNYIILPSQYITNFGQNGGKKITIPLIKVYDIAYETDGTDSFSIKQTINLRILIGHQRKYIRIHRQQIFIYTLRNQIQTFQIDIDYQKTDICQTNSECIVIADLDTDKQVTKSDYITSINTSTYLYTVGEKFYARIFFKDSSYTKKLEFIRLIFKNDSNQIYDFSSLTVTSWDDNDNSLHIQLTLIEPSPNAQIQVSMLIQPDFRRFRSLQEVEQQKVRTQFTVNIVNPPNSHSAQSEVNNISNKSSALSLLSRIINLIILFTCI